MTLIEYIIAYKYLAVFIGAIIEGPVLMAAVGFLIKLGYVEPVLAYVALVFGDLAGDIAWYYLGYFNVFAVLSGFGEFIGFKKRISDKVAKLYRNHETKILFLSKITMGFGFSLVVLVTAGILKVSIKKFAAVNLLGGIIWTAVMVTLGYFFGSLYLILEKGTRLGSLVLMTAVLILILHSLGRYFRKKYFNNHAN